MSQTLFLTEAQARHILETYDLCADEGVGSPSVEIQAEIEDYIKTTYPALWRELNYWWFPENQVAKAEEVAVQKQVTWEETVEQIWKEKKVP